MHNQYYESLHLSGLFQLLAWCLLPSESNNMFQKAIMKLFNDLLVCFKEVVIFGVVDRCDHLLVNDMLQMIEKMLNNSPTNHNTKSKQH